MEQEIYGGTIRIRNGTLESVASNGSLAWTWRPAAARVVGILAVPGGSDVIVLTEPNASLPRGAPTLFRVHGGGGLAWTAQVVPGGDGTYVAAEAHRSNIAANTWDGRRVVIDIDTGSITAVSFAK